MLFVEIGYNQAESVSRLFEESFTNIEVFKDYGGNDRVVVGTVSPNKISANTSFMHLKA